MEELTGTIRQLLQAEAQLRELEMPIKEVVQDAPLPQSGDNTKSYSEALKG